LINRTFKDVGNIGQIKIMAFREKMQKICNLQAKNEMFFYKKGGSQSCLAVGIKNSIKVVHIDTVTRTFLKRMSYLLKITVD
jgi:hypothetical protein